MDDFEEFEDEIYYKESKRERRMRDRIRMIERGKRYYKQNHIPFWSSDNKFIFEEAEIHGRKFHDNLAICSCDGCGNQRHNRWSSPKYRITNQERRALQDANQQFAELGLYKRKRKS